MISLVNVFEISKTQSRFFGFLVLALVCLLPFNAKLLVPSSATIKKTALQSEDW